MKERMSFNFFAQPKIIAGLHALELIPGELELMGASHPLIIIEAEKKQKTLKLIEQILADSVCEPRGYIFYQNEDSSPSERIQTGIDLFQKSLCDSIIVFGHGEIHSYAKLLGYLISEGRTFDELPSKAVSHKEPSRSIPKIGITQELTDGNAGSDRLVYGELVIEAPQMYHDVIIIDERFLGRYSLAEVAGSCCVSLLILLEAIQKKTRNIQMECWCTPALQTLLDIKQLIFASKETTTATVPTETALAIAQTHIYAAIAHSNAGYGPLEAIIDTCTISGLATTQESASALLPVYAHLFEKTELESLAFIGSNLCNVSYPAASCESYDTQVEIEALNSLVETLVAGATFSKPIEIIRSLIRGVVTLIHRADRQDELLSILETTAHTTQPMYHPNKATSGV